MMATAGVAGRSSPPLARTRRRRAGHRTTWDDNTLAAQEGTVGRFKYSGAFLDRSDDTSLTDEPPLFQQDQSNETVPVDSHVRKVNPGRPEDRPREIFRRGYALISAGGRGLNRGLLFICFGRTISTQFEFISGPGCAMRTSRDPERARTGSWPSIKSSVAATTSFRQ